MWNILFVGLLLCTPLLADVSHLPGVKHPGYPSHTPDHPLELPGESTQGTGTVAGYPSVVPQNPLELPDASSAGNTVAGYPRVVPDNPLQVPEASSGNVQNRRPDPQLQGSSTGGGLSVQQLQSNQNQGHHHDHHYHGEDGKYNPHDDGSGWDIRKSVPGEPGQDYPTYDSVPSTSFTCKEKAPGYYADEEARCQVFRICTTNSLKTYNSFLCPNGSLFNQRVLTCDWWMNVDCASSSDFYYKNLDIGKMPTGQQLMYEVSKMLEAPNKHPYSFTQQNKQFIDQTLQDNQIQGTGPIHDVYLPAKQPVVVTTQTYYSPPTTTTTTTTPKPIQISNLNRVETNKFDLKQNSFSTVTATKQEEDKAAQQSFKNVQNQYIPPPAPTVDISSLSNVKTHQKPQINQASTSGLTGYNDPKPIPSLATSQVTNQQSPSVTVTKEQTKTVTHSQKTTHVFQNLDDGPNKISLLQNTVPNVNTGSVAQTDNRQFVEQQQQQAGILQQSLQGVQQQPQVQLPQIQQTSSSGVQQQNTGFQQQGVSFVNTQEKIVPSPVQTFTKATIQSTQFQPELSKEQAFQQIDNIQAGLQQIQQQQNKLNQFGQGVLTPREFVHPIPAADFGQNIGISQFQGGFSQQGVQPNLFAEQNFPTGEYIQNQGYQYQQPNFHEQNLQNYNFHGQHSGQNFNVQVAKDGSAQNFNGESLTQHSNGHTHSTFSGHNVAYKESTKVDVVPSLGFHLNDDYEKNSYISAVLSGLINDGPRYQSSASSNFGQNQFVPSDVRFSSYQGPSSYLAPQASVQRLPSDSGYYR